MLKAVVVDDEVLAREELKFLLSQEDVVIVGEADNGGAAIALAAETKPQAVFLDIDMKNMSGLETAKILRKILPDTVIIFATAHDNYAINAFELGAVDYLLKPFAAERVQAAVARIREYLMLRQTDSKPDAMKGKISVDKLPVEYNGKIMLINYCNISYAYSSGGIVKIVAERCEYYYNGTLTELEEKLAEFNFMRVHKSYVVNMTKVKEVIPWFKGTYWLKLEGISHEIPVSKGQIKDIKDILGIK